MPRLLNEKNVGFDAKLQEGDAGIVLRKDGTFVAFQLYKDFDPLNMTERQKEQGNALIAFSTALAVPALMDMLLNVANNPAVFEQTGMVGATTKQ